MKGSLLQGLGPPPKQAPLLAYSTTSLPTLPPNLLSCRYAHRHSGSPKASSQQQLLHSDTGSLVSFVDSSNLYSPFYGDTVALSQQMRWRNEGEVTYTRSPIFIRSSYDSFQQSHRTRATFPCGSRQPGRTSNVTLKSNSTNTNGEEKSSKHLNPAGHLEQSRSPSLHLQSGFQVVTKPVTVDSSSEDTTGFQVVTKPVIVDSSSEHTAPWLSEQSPLRSDEMVSVTGPYAQLGPRMEQSLMISDRPLVRSSQNGVNAPASSYRSQVTSNRQRYSGSVLLNQKKVQQVIDEFRKQCEAHGRSFQVNNERKYEGSPSLQRGREDIPAAQLESPPPRVQTSVQYKRTDRALDFTDRQYEGSPSLQHVRQDAQVAQLEPPTPRFQTSVPYRREGRSVEVINERKYDSSPSSRPASQANQAPRVESSPPGMRMGARMWSEAAKRIEENRKIPHAVGRTGVSIGNSSSPNVELSLENSNSLDVELEAMVDFETEPKGPEGDGTYHVNAIKLENGYRGPKGDRVLRSQKQRVLQVEEPEELSSTEERESPESNGSETNERSARNRSVIEHRLKLGSDEVSSGAEIRTQPDGEQQWLNSEVMVVDSVAAAESVVKKLMGQYKDLVHACDTEVADIDVKKESPVGHGRLVCFSIYCGPKADFGGGKCRLWVDVLGKDAVTDVFKSYFEDPAIKKVWHNYSFDKHILGNHGIRARGFYADTMHLARLHDSARTVAQGGYSLEGLTADKFLMGDNLGGLTDGESGGKRSMKNLFGKPNIKKNGEEGKLRVVPPVEELQTDPQSRDKWIHYSSFDTVCTWRLWRSLRDKLLQKEWMIEGKFRQEGKSMYDFYLEYVQPFGELLVQMEAEGMLLDRDHLAKIEEIAIKQQEFSANRFKQWAAKRCPDAIYMNVGSDAQVRQLLFGGKQNKADPKRRLEMERVFKAPNTDNYIEEGKKIPKKTRPFTLHGLGVDIPVDTYTSAGWPAVGGAAIKALAGKVAIDYSLLDEEAPAGDVLLGDLNEGSAILTSTGVKGGSEEDLSVYGKAYDAFGGGKEGKEACMALAALCEVASINTLISNFIQPLQGSDIKGPDGRVHCSLNINTETGRLSARRPSLQNQPALEKDRYKIRQAFVASPGNSLIVADYGQLELRILAHLTNCKSMLKAFVDGGDFHSRTAMNMYPHVRKAVEKGDVILEWEPKPGEDRPPVPLLKDVFGGERRKAKMLNFSIAYGKTAMGLSKDWKVSLDEAQSTVDLWYSDRQEVRQWQEQRIKEAFETHHVHTLLGRTRHFPDATSSSRLVLGHIERAAINTPVQGSAADVAMCAMLEISRNKTLQELGWKMLLQVHDEVILEGPAGSADVAKDIVVKCMGFPFGGKNHLRVALVVDANSAGSWYAAK